MFFEHQPKFGKKRGKKKNDNFSHFAKHRFIKKPRFVAICFFCFFFCAFQFVLFETKNIDVEQKHNLRSGKSKDKKKGFETEKQDRKPKERENISGKKRNCN